MFLIIFNIGTIRNYEINDVKYSHPLGKKMEQFFVTQENMQKKKLELLPTTETSAYYLQSEFYIMILTLYLLHYQMW